MACGMHACMDPTHAAAPILLVTMLDPLTAAHTGTADAHNGRQLLLNSFAVQLLLSVNKTFIMIDASPSNLVL